LGSGPTTPTPEARRPITRLVITSIDLDTDVVAAPLVDSAGVQTWQVPAFKAGHAQDTAGAGQRGNAILIGHVSSLNSGDVFKNLPGCGTRLRGISRSTSSFVQGLSPADENVKAA
jgi:hypothetical protein